MLPQADAGDDQIVLVGRRITLNGSCRTPADAVAYRWFQVDGPKVEQSSQDRSYYSFTPSTPGVYVFGLVVATCDRVTGPTISEPDDVVVTAAQMPPSNVVSPAGPVPAAIPPSTLDQAVRTARSYGDRDLLDKVAGTFESIAERATLYSSFAELSSEVMPTRQGDSQGLELAPVVGTRRFRPPDPVHRIGDAPRWPRAGVAPGPLSGTERDPEGKASGAVRPLLPGVSVAVVVTPSHRTDSTGTFSRMSFSWKPNGLSILGGVIALAAVASLALVNYSGRRPWLRRSL